MAEIISIVEMNTGETGKVMEFFGGHGMTRNLENMGIRIGTEIKKVSQQFMRGPVMIQQNHTTVAIGFGMAQRIMIEPNGVDKK